MAETPTALRRRDFLMAGVVGLGGLVALKVGVRALWGAAPPPLALPADRLVYMTARQEAIVTAVALAMVGPTAESAYLDGRWDPAGHMDGIMGIVAPDQRQLMGTGILLLEEWTIGFTGFSRLSRQEQVVFLERWRLSSLALHRSIWGLMHGGCTSSFAAVPAGSRGLMGHPGPCVGTGRAPGQTVAFNWDEAVP